MLPKITPFAKTINFLAIILEAGMILGMVLPEQNGREPHEHDHRDNDKAFRRIRAE
jgi:hypothetical protein